MSNALLDSNIIIYAAQSKHGDLREFIRKHVPAVSVLSYVEVLGYHMLSEIEKRLFTQFFSAAPLLELSSEVLEQAVRLRQVRKMTLGDSLIAGTALAHGLILVTRNIEDFRWVPGLKTWDPLA